MIVVRAVTNVENDRTQRKAMGRKAELRTGCEDLTALADRGYFNGEQVLACRGNMLAQLQFRAHGPSAAPCSQRGAAPPDSRGRGRGTASLGPHPWKAQP